SREEAAFGRHGCGAFGALHGDGDGPALARREIEIELGPALGKARRGRAEADAHAPRQGVERLVVVLDLASRHDARADASAARAPVAADLEQIREVGAELERAAQAPAALAVARHGEQLVAARLPQELGPGDVERVLA